MTLGRFVLALSLLTMLFSAGCTQRLYYWGDYEENLYAYYKSPGAPEDTLAYMGRLERLIERGEQPGRKVPPGVYAEYGYAFYKTGRPREAVQYFEKEKSVWPESGLLMDRMIKNVQSLAPNKPDTSPVSPPSTP